MSSPRCTGPAIRCPSWTPVTRARAPLRQADLRDRTAVAAALTGVDVVVHQAAMVGLGVDLDDLPEYVGCNDLGTAVLLAEMARAGIHRLVLASSMVVYGEGAYTCLRHGAVRPAARAATDLAARRFEPACSACGADLEPGLIDEEAPLDPRSVYAATKVAQEHLTAAWCRQTGGTVVALRYHNVYGPGMPRDTPYSGVAAIFRSALAAGRARACSRTADSDATSSTSSTWPTPVVTGEFRLGDVRHVVASPARAQDELGFRAAVRLADGVRQFAHAPLRG